MLTEQELWKQVVESGPSRRLTKSAIEATLKSLAVLLAHSAKTRRPVAVRIFAEVVDDTKPGDATAKCRKGRRFFVVRFEE